MHCRSPPFCACSAPRHQATSRHRECSSFPKPRASVTTRFRPASRPSGSWAPRGASTSTPPKTPLPLRRRNLARYRAVVFLNSSGEVFDDRAEGGVPGFHPRRRRAGRRASRGHHAGQVAVVRRPGRRREVRRAPEASASDLPVRDRDHPATKDLPDSWKWTEEWYNFHAESPPADPRPDDGRREFIQGRDDGQGPSRSPGITRPREGASGARPWAHQGRLQPAPSAQAPARAASATPRDSPRSKWPSAKADDRRLDPQARAFLEEAEDSGAAGIRDAAGRGGSQAVSRHVASWPVRRRRSTRSKIALCPAVRACGFTHRRDRVRSRP